MIDTSRTTSLLPWMVDLAPCGIVALQPDGLIVFINETMLEWLDLHRDAVERKLNIQDLLSRAVAIYFQTNLMPRLLLTGAFQEVAITLRNVKGRPRKTLLAGRRIAQTGEAILVFTPSEERSRVEDDLARIRDIAQTRLTWLDQIERIADIGAWSLDLETSVFTWSDQVFAIHGLPVGAAPSIEQARNFYPDFPHDNSPEEAINRAVQSRAPFQFEAWLRRKQIQKRVRIRGQAQWEMGRPKRILGVIEDITEQSSATEKLWKAAHVDQLSGLPNRRWFTLKLTELIIQADQDKSSLSLIFLDLDRFKEVNDLHGHTAGDEVIRVVAHRIRSSLPPNAFVCRLGGDEFAAVLPDKPGSRGVDEFAARLLTALGLPILLTETEITLQATIGISRFPDDALTSEGLVRSADMALIHAKRVCKGTALSFDAKIGRAASDRRSAIHLVRQAASNGRIIAHYQPRIDLSTGTTRGFEALARIVERDGTVIGPAIWGPALDDPDCARLVDGHVFRSVIADWPRLGVSGMGNRSGSYDLISLNCSEHTLRRDNFVTDFLRSLENHSIPTDAIEIEVLETVLVEDAGSRLLDQLTQLRHSGVSVALDDFGTGYASLMHLLGLPIDRIKLDRSFMFGLDDELRNRAIVEAMVKLAHALGIKVVAEGVETESVLHFLLSTGCDEAQGFYFGMPQAR